MGGSPTGGRDEHTGADKQMPDGGAKVVIVGAAQGQGAPRPAPRVHARTPFSRGVFSRASAGHKRKSLVKIGEVTRAQRCWLYVPTGNLFDDRRSHPAEKTPDTWALGTRGADRRFGTPPPIPVTYGAPLP